jgi:transposase
MFCSACLKLAKFVTRKKCIKCQAEVLNNISVLCEQCSNSQKICSVCLKKIVDQLKQLRHRGCGRCGHK